LNCEVVVGLAVGIVYFGIDVYCVIALTREARHMASYCAGHVTPYAVGAGRGLSRG
jgi:hypothetical protein